MKFSIYLLWEISPDSWSQTNPGILQPPKMMGFKWEGKESENSDSSQTLMKYQANT